MSKQKVYNPLFQNNRDGLVRIVKTRDFEKNFQEFNQEMLKNTDSFIGLLQLYANTLSKGISEELGLRVSPFIRQNAIIDGDSLKYGRLDLFFICGGRNFWTKYHGDCIVTSDINVANNVVTSNRVIFDSFKMNYNDDEFTDPFYDVIKNVSDSFAEKTNLKFDYTYYIDGHPNPISMDTCPMSYKIHYVSKNKKKMF